MAANSNSHDPDGKAIGKAPENIASTTKVNVAFPFSQVKIAEPSDQLISLTTLVCELTRLVAEMAPGPEVRELQRRANELVSQTH
jgi:hypothetical protein